MRVAIIHYHLRPGGVTRVIETAARGLAAAGVEVVVLVGEEPVGTAVPVRVVAGLGYSRETGDGKNGSNGNDGTAGLGYFREAGAHSSHYSHASHWEGPRHLREPVELAAALRAAAAEALGGPPDIWHFHNPALGKNVLLADVVAQLAEAGERLVLQLHDLVEDGRPGNYALVAGCRRLYPAGPRVRYAFLNSRDLGRFLELGLPAEHAVLLPNAVAGEPGPVGSSQPDSPLVLYPVRGIRRKNLGEMVLLAALAPAGVRFAVTGAPAEAPWRGIHDDWQAFALEQRLPVEFAVAGRLAPVAGAATTFEGWRANATHLLTTAVAEGFGFAYLDAVALGKPLLGRNLPHLTADHAAQGLARQRGLYDRILVPATAVEPAAFEAELRTALAAAYRDYGREVSEPEAGRALAALVGDGWLDFGNLPEKLQRDVIVHAAADPASCDLWVETGGARVNAAAWLAEQLFGGAAVPESADLSPWSEANCVARMLALYADLAGQSAVGIRFLEPGRLLEICLSPESFHFLQGRC